VRRAGEFNSPKSRGENTWEKTQGTHLPVPRESFFDEIFPWVWKIDVHGRNLEKTRDNFPKRVKSQAQAYYPETALLTLLYIYFQWKCARYFFLAQLLYSKQSALQSAFPFNDRLWIFSHQSKCSSDT
jgi:hypothetical protein